MGGCEAYKIHVPLQSSAGEYIKGGGKHIQSAEAGLAGFSEGRLTQETITFQVTFSILGWSLIGKCELSGREDKYQNPRIPAAGSVFANANK